MATKITVSQFDRQMSEVLNRVAYRGESFIIERGGKEVARLEPAVREQAEQADGQQRREDPGDAIGEPAG